MAGLTMVALSGCGLFTRSEPEPPPPGCPPVHALIGADRVSSYRTAEPRIEDLRFVAAINSVRSRCSVDDDELEVDLAFEMVAERGPALEPGPLQLGYFVVTLAPGNRVVAKQLFPIEFTFGPDGIAGMTEILALKVPGVDPRAPPSRRLLVGFTLQGDQQLAAQPSTADNRLAPSTTQP